jgi:hypothetical protein
MVTPLPPPSDTTPTPEPSDQVLAAAVVRAVALLRAGASREDAARALMVGADAADLIDDRVRFIARLTDEGASRHEVFNAVITLDRLTPAIKKIRDEKNRARKKSATKKSATQFLIPRPRG